MITIIIAAVITVIVVIGLLAPVMIDPAKRKQGWMFLYAITLIAMGLYLWRGAPDLPSQPAAFEKEGENFEKRRLVKKEMELIRALSENPDDTQIMLSLGSVRLQIGRIDEAINVLTMAYNAETTEGLIPVRIKLGAAHYAAALSAVFIDNDRDKAQDHFNKALLIAPKDSPYRERLEQDIKSFHEEAE